MTNINTYTPDTSYSKKFWIYSLLPVVMLLPFSIPLGLFLNSLIIPLAVLVVVYILSIWLSNVWLRTIVYEVNEDHISTRLGIITKTQKVVPFRTITNLNVNRGPLDRLLGLTTIKIETAGASGAQARPEEVLVGLSEADATAIRTSIDTKLRSFRAGTAGITHEDDQEDIMIQIRDTLQQINAKITTR